MLRTALILALGLVTPASADLWTSLRTARTPTAARSTTRAPVNRVAESGPLPDAAAGPTRSLTVIVDHACFLTAAVVEDTVRFARTHGDVAVRVILARPPGRTRQSVRGLVVAAQGGLDIAWVPAEVRRRAPAALPAVYLDDGQGQGVRATGRPPLEALWRRVLTGTGP